mmetsp:Transcript_102878/g.204204  ORF Transcript_102878/g.204204 Transcript_102878/m.204204 type:complete len:289 (-) Transcript_102878:277-1143(-)
MLSKVTQILKVSPKALNAVLFPGLMMLLTLTKTMDQQAKSTAANRLSAMMTVSRTPCFWQIKNNRHKLRVRLKSASLSRESEYGDNTNASGWPSLSGSSKTANSSLSGLIIGSSSLSLSTICIGEDPPAPVCNWCKDAVEPALVTSEERLIMDIFRWDPKHAVDLVLSRPLRFVVEPKPLRFVVEPLSMHWKSAMELLPVLLILVIEPTRFWDEMDLRGFRSRISTLLLPSFVMRCADSRAIARASRTWCCNRWSSSNSKSNTLWWNWITVGRCATLRKPMRLSRHAW